MIDFTGAGRREGLATLMRLAEKERHKPRLVRWLETWWPSWRNADRWLRTVVLVDRREVD